MYFKRMQKGIARLIPGYGRSSVSRRISPLPLDVVDLPILRDWHRNHGYENRAAREYALSRAASTSDNYTAGRLRVAKRLTLWEGAP